MKKGLCGVLAALAVGLWSLSIPAQAVTYSVDFSGSFFDVFATINTDGLNNVTSITGSVVGPSNPPTAPTTPISGLEPLGNPNWIYDNQFFGSTPHVDNGGILFASGAFDYNLYSVVSGSSVQYFLSTFNPNGTLYNPGDLGRLDVSATPLPAALPLFASVLGGGGFLAWRRKKKGTTRSVPLGQAA